MQEDRKGRGNAVEKQVDSILIMGGATPPGLY
jgi:hypothetical protein